MAFKNTNAPVVSRQFKTADSGRRIEMGDPNNNIRFYSGLASEKRPAQISISDDPNADISFFFQGANSQTDGRSLYVLARRSVDGTAQLEFAADNIVFNGTPNFLLSPQIVSPGVLTGAWTASGRGAGYYKSVDGVIHLTGRVTGGTLGTQIFVLPSGARPVEQLQFAVNANGSYGSLRIDTSGAVVFTAGSTTQVSLSGVNFPTF